MPKPTNPPTMLNRTGSLYDGLRRDANADPWRARRKTAEPPPAPVVEESSVESEGQVVFGGESVTSWDGASAAPAAEPAPAVPLTPTPVTVAAPATEPAPSEPVRAESLSAGEVAEAVRQLTDPTYAQRQSESPDGVLQGFLTELGSRERAPTPTPPPRDAGPGPQPPPDAGPQPATTPYNAYIYVVGTDVQGKGDFNEMRKVLANETTYEHPSVVVTYDFKTRELRKRWKQSADATPKDETFTLGDSFDVIYGDLEGMAAANQRVRQLHILTHFGGDHVYFSPTGDTSTSDLAARDQAKLRASFAPDAVVKIHGCQLDTDVVGKIYAFAKKKEDPKGTRDDVRDRLAKAYPTQLSAAIGVPVWAAPMGTYAIYQCSYLSARERHRRFCVEVKPGVDHSYETTVRFYEANYDRFFDRAAGEGVLDSTYHLKYKGSVKTDDVPLAEPVADVPARAQEVREPVFAGY
jgi:hypothetical protein